MALPKQVQAQLDAANRALEEANKPPGSIPVPEPTPPTEPAANAPQASPEPPTPAAPVVEAPKQEETWEARYKALKGMYNKQVPELQQQVNDLATRLDAAVKRLEQVPTQPKPPEPPAPTADPQDVEAFGEDLVNMVKRTAERMFGGAARQMDETLGRIDGRLTELEKRLTGTAQTAQQTAEQTFFDRLTKLVPNWEEINEDERFKAWCVEVDPAFGVPRQRGLQAAQDNLDADRVAAFLRAYTTGHTQTPPPKVTTPPVDTQVSPRAVASAPPPAPTNKPVLTTQQVEQFYRDIAQGRYRGREAEQQRIEQVINDALAEGRIH
jgi:uncharacterized protein YukE